MGLFPLLVVPVDEEGDSEVLVAGLAVDVLEVSEWGEGGGDWGFLDGRVAEERREDAGTKEERRLRSA